MELNEKEKKSYVNPEHQVQDSKIRIDFDSVRDGQKREKNEYIDSAVEEVNKASEERKESELWQTFPTLKKLNDVLYSYSKYLSTHENNVYDIELSKEMLNALYELNNNEYLLMEFVFAKLSEKAETDQDLANVLPEWENYFNEYKQQLAKEQIDESTKNDKRVSFFTKILNKIQGVDSNEIEKPRVR